MNNQYATELMHHGIIGQKWGKRNGPPYPLNHERTPSFSEIKSSVSTIANQVKKDRKAPTGNQNCKLCTWALEARCRGFNVLPRPIYSPMDKGLHVKGYAIVNGAKKERVKDRDSVIQKSLDAGDASRYYIHVKWAGGPGGHEFMIINNKGSIKVVDPQQGLIKDVNGASDYLGGVNYTKSYMVRLDNKAFNKSLLNEISDRKRTLEWDPYRDIPFMIKKGMVSQEEGLAELQRMPQQNPV